MENATLASSMNIGRLSEYQTPSRSPSNKKTAKMSAKQRREAQQKSLSFHAKRLCLHSDWTYIRSHEEVFPMQREAEAAKENILALKTNPSYSQSGVIQSYGRLNSGDQVCTCCARVFASGRTRTWKGCVSFPTDLTYPDRDRGEGSVPFLGQCANCHWGSQGWKCSLRVGGVKIPPRRQRADLFQSSVFRHTHLGNKHDMNSLQGCNDAKNELQGIINQVARRITALKNGRDVESIEEENARYDEEDNGDGEDVHIGPSLNNYPSKPLASPTPTPRPTSSPRPRPRPRRRGNSHTPRTPLPRSKSRDVVASMKDEGDDESEYESDYVGPKSTQSVSRTGSKPRTRQSSRVSSTPQRSRAEVVIPSLRSSR